MTSLRSWRKYPPTYRAKELEILASWIQAGESGSIIGPAGAGKSNLVGFICHQPDVIAEQYLRHTLKAAIVLVDLNNLTSQDLSTLYRVILRSLASL